MTRDEVIERLLASRGEFDALVAEVPPEAFDRRPPGRAHAVKEILAHVAGYEELIVGRLREAREGRMTDFERDRVGWEAFNEHVWAQAREMDAEGVRTLSSAVFADLMGEVERLTDAELNETVGVTAGIDPAWLEGRSLWELIGVDAFDHYPMHREGIEAAVAMTGG